MSGFDPLADRPLADPSASPSLLTVTCSGSPATVNVPFSLQPSVSGGTGPYTWTASGLPPGLSIDSSSGLISGIPTSGGSYLINVRATDSLSVVGDATPQPTIQIMVYGAAPAPLITDSNMGPYQVHVRTPYGYGVPPGSGPVRVSWSGLEVAHIGTSLARVSWYGLEVAHIGTSLARVSWFGVEVLRSVDRGPARPFGIDRVILELLRDDDDYLVEFTQPSPRRFVPPLVRSKPWLFTVT